MGTAASSFLNPVAAELDGRGRMLTAERLSRRITQRRQILARADSALYAAKARGRNRIANA